MGWVPCQGHERDLNILIACHIESQNISIWKASRRIIESSSLPKVISDESWIITCEGTKLRADSPESAYVRRKEKKIQQRVSLPFHEWSKLCREAAKFFIWLMLPGVLTVWKRTSAMIKHVKLVFGQSSLEHLWLSEANKPLPGGHGAPEGLPPPVSPWHFELTATGRKGCEIKKRKSLFLTMGAWSVIPWPRRRCIIESSERELFKKKKKEGIFKPANSDRARGVVLN